MTDPIPEGAQEIIHDTWEDGARRSAFYTLDGQQVGYRSWTAEGQIDMEYGIQDGVQHGVFRTWHENGQICELSFYDRGREHGITRQYDEQDTLIGSYTIEHGTGVDLWFGGPGTLAEERHCLDGDRHGYERWWNSDNRTIWLEGHFWHGEEHGIFREWSARGRLRRGYPRYVVAGQQVDRRRYERARRGDPSLPPPLASENAPLRPLPAMPQLPREGEE